MYAPPSSNVEKSEDAALKWRSRVVRGAVWLLIVCACLVSLRLVAAMWVGKVILNECLSVRPDPTPQKCECLAERMADRVVTFDYLVRRLVREEYLPDREVRDIRKACDV